MVGLASEAVAPEGQVAVPRGLKEILQAVLRVEAFRREQRDVVFAAVLVPPSIWQLAACGVRISFRLVCPCPGDGIHVIDRSDAAILFGTPRVLDRREKQCLQHVAFQRPFSEHYHDLKSDEV